MTASNKTTIKSYFETNDKPTQSQFGDLIDSYVDTIGGAMTGDLQLPAIPVSALSATNKQYVDATVSSAVAAVSIASAAITSGTINGATIGATTPTTGAFTRVSAASMNISGVVSAATVAAAAATITGITYPVGIIDRAYSTYASYSNLNVVIPADNTPPLNTEGTSVLSATITPKSATTRLRARFAGFAGGGTTALSLCTALFINSIVTAVQATAGIVTSTSSSSPMAMEYEYVPGTTTAQTITVRAGPGSTGSMFMNGTNQAQLFGGIAAATLILEEIYA